MSDPEEVHVKLSAAGRLLIPARLRKSLGLHVGDELLLTRDADRLVITSRTAALRRAQAAATKFRTDESEVDGLIADRRAEATND